MGESRDTASLVNKIFNLNLLKFKHVYGSPEKKENCYDNIKITKNANDSMFCCANPKFLAVVTEVTGGGAFLVLDLKNVGRIEENYGKVVGHAGPVLDIKFCPFNDNLIASCSDDCTIKVWHIPDKGIGRKSIVDPVVTLAEHKRRVNMIEWHPTADSILFSVGFDHQILIWRTSTAEVIGSINCHPDTIQSFSFNRDGSLIATTCKDKCIRVIDPRTAKVISKGKGHQGSKSSKVVFLDKKLFTTGFSKYSDRQWAIWDMLDLREPLTIENIDSSSGVMFPIYDHDTKMVYIAGKGDGSIRYYELVNEPPYCHYISQFITGFPQRGLGVMPKRGLDTTKCEIFRFYKLHAMKSTVEPISMIVPRKSSLFQPDIYPDTAAPTPATSAEEWMRGINRMPILVSMKTNTFNKTHKPMIQQHTDVNNDKKFIFISQDNVIDYRDIVGEKNGYTSPQNQTQLLNQRNNSLSNSNSFNNAIHHSSSHSSLSNGSSNSYHHNSNHNNSNSNNNVASTFGNNQFNARNISSYHDSPFIENISNLNNINGKWNKETDYLVEDELPDSKSSPRKKSNQKYFFNDHNSYEYNDNNGELNELEEVRRQITNGRLTRGSTGLLIFEDALPKNYEDLLTMFKNQLEEIHILKELNQKKDMKIKELEDLLEDFKMVDC